MDGEALTIITDHFLAGFRSDDPEEIRTAEALIGNRLRGLPEPDTWLPRHGEQGWSPKAFLLLGDRLVEVSAYRDEQGVVHVKSTARPLTNSGIVIGLESYDRRTYDGKAGHKTKWTFRFREGADLVVDGSMQTSPTTALSDTEDFARAVAAQVGEVVVP